MKNGSSTHFLADERLKQKPNTLSMIKDLEQTMTVAWVKIKTLNVHTILNLYVVC